MVHRRVGHYAFLLGIGIAVISGLFPSAIAGTSLLLVILGLIVGFLNVKHKQMNEFLVASIVLIVAGSAGLRAIDLWNLGNYLASMLINMSTFVAPAAIVVAIKAVWESAEK